jgi:hypothetical protein
MWTEADVTVEIDEADENVMLVVIATPVGKLQIIGNITRIGRVLHVHKAHADGLHPGALGRAGLNAVGRKLLVEADVDEIIIEGGTRTTGKNVGRPPKPFRFPSH